ncbi:MAG: hypothetical protein MUE60_08965, partial [Candidatus Eisenbacteria bacterium]|nr:hypothetical protein [Candidatus Eisenbacteria bacterium]
ACMRSARRRAGMGLFVTLVVLCSCNVGDLLYDDDLFAAQVTVRNFAGTDGCGWVLESGPHDHYEPTNLDPAFHHEGLQVWVQLRRRHDLASFCMVGPIVDVISIHTGVDAPNWAPGAGS